MPCWHGNNRRSVWLVSAFRTTSCSGHAFIMGAMQARKRRETRRTVPYSRVKGQDTPGQGCFKLASRPGKLPRQGCFKPPCLAPARGTWPASPPAEA